MQVALLILPILMPVLFWSGYHYHKDRHLPEPLANLAICFLLGIAASWISKGMYMALGAVELRFDAGYLAMTSLGKLFAYALLAIGPIEEIAKLIPFLLVVIRFRSFDEPVDGIIYASFIGLGYATIENYNYLPYLTTMEGIARGFASPLVHMLFASIWGYVIGRAHLDGRQLFIPVVGSLAAAALLHGVYDFVVLAMPLSALPLSAFLILAVWIWRMRLIASLHDPAGDR